MDNHTVVNGNTFCNPGAITFADAIGPGGVSVYPSRLFVSGLPGTIEKVTAQIKTLNHARPDDIDLLLVSPNGTKFILMSDAGGTTAASAATLTFDDAAASTLPDAGPIVTGTFRPSSFTGPDSFPARAPVGPYLTPESEGTAKLDAFNGVSPNGTWTLYVVDDIINTGQVNTIANGWCLTFVINLPPTVSNVPKSGNEDGTVTFAAADFAAHFTDADAGDTLQTLRITSLPVNGTLKLGAVNVVVNQDIPAAQIGNLNYTPAANYNGADSFTWNASDGAAFAVSGAAVNLTVTEVNDAPAVVADTLPDRPEDNVGSLIISGSALTGNDSKGPANESTQTLTVTAVSAPVGGTVGLNAGNITFTLTPDFNGAASFTYTVTDNGTTNGAAASLTANGTVSFTVTEVNDAPVAVDDPRPNIAEDAAPVVIAASVLAANDSKGAANQSTQTLTVTAVSNPVGGTVNLAAGNITFTPTRNYNGPASYGYTVSDNGTTNGAANAKTDFGAATFTITAVNDNPVAVADVLERSPGMGVTVTKAALIANDTDVDGDTVAFVSVAAASANGGTVTSNATQVIYTPAAGFTGVDTFTYNINDGHGGTATGTVTVALSLNATLIETLPGGSVRLTFTGIPNRTYRVQSNESLTPASWTVRLSIAADAQGKFQFTDPAPLPRRRFYRAIFP